MKPVDLARARAAEERIAARVAANPALAARTSAMLAGELPCPDLEDPMPRAGQHPFNVRLPATIIARLDALIPAAHTAPELVTTGRITRSDVIRVALVRGLAQLEAELADAAQPGLPGVG